MILRSTIVNEFKRKRSMLLAFLLISGPWAVFLLGHGGNPLALAGGIVAALFALLQVGSLALMRFKRAHIEARIEASMAALDG